MLCLLSRIPLERQKLRSGFPPRELHPPSDPSQPVALANGERVSVDILPASTPVAMAVQPQAEEEDVKGEPTGQSSEAAGGEESELKQQAQQAQQTQQGTIRSSIFPLRD